MESLVDDNGSPSRSSSSSRSKGGGGGEHLSSLPPELILAIARFVDSGRDLSALARTSRGFYAALLRYRYRQGVRAAGGDGLGLLTWAIRRRRRETLREALAAGAPAACPLPSCAAPGPLELAAQYNFEELVAELLKLRPAAEAEAEADAQVRCAGDDGGDAGDSDGRAADAAPGGTGRRAAGAVVDIDVNVRSARGQAPLCWAAAHRNAELARMLLRVEGVDLETRDPYGRTPLAIAAGHGDAALVDVLLGHGADANSPVVPEAKAASQQQHSPGGGGGGGAPETRDAAAVVVDAAIQEVLSKLLEERAAAVQSKHHNMNGDVDSAPGSSNSSSNSSSNNSNVLSTTRAGWLHVYDSCSVPLLLAVGSGHLDIARTLVAHGAHLHLETTTAAAATTARERAVECRCGDMYAAAAAVGATGGQVHT